MPVVLAGIVGVGGANNGVGVAGVAGAGVVVVEVLGRDEGVGVWGVGEGEVGEGSVSLLGEIVPFRIDGGRCCCCLSSLSPRVSINNPPSSKKDTRLGLGVTSPLSEADDTPTPAPPGGGGTFSSSLCAAPEHTT